MNDQIVNLAYDVLAILLPVLAIMLAEWLRRKLGIERLQKIQKELQTKQELATLAVRFVEQAYRDFKGDVKYEAAVTWLVNRAEEIGITVNSDEIQGLIEAALRAFKDEFGEGWANLAKEESG